MKSSVRSRLLSREAVFGTWCMLPSAPVVDVIAQSGLDFVIVDLEHGSISLETAENMVRAAQLHGCQPIIRVGDSQQNTILRALETGCKAVMVPHVASAEAAKAVVSAARYTPLGTRGLSPYTRCHGYDHSDLQTSLEHHAQETFVGVLVEGSEGLERMPKIAAVPGIDMIYLGLYDISMSIGIPGDIDSPKVRDELARCARLITDAGKVAGTFARDIDQARALKDSGFGFVAYLADSNALIQFFRDATLRF